MSYCRLRNLWTNEWECQACKQSRLAGQKEDEEQCQYEETFETYFIDYDEDNDDYHILPI